jgi:Domain of unknown function (DUF5655)
MQAHECYHCKQWVEEGEAHDCWTTTEAALTADLSEDLRDAWERLRESAVELGPQRVYASGSCIMFSRTVCYFFVRPKRSFLEVVIFLGRTIHNPRIRRADPKSKTKVAHILQIRHRDEVETPLTDWLQEAYEFEAAPKTAPKAAKSGAKSVKPAKVATAAKKASAKKAPAKKTPAKKTQQRAPAGRASRSRRR